MPDNRYYIFKDAKGGKHTVDKAAYDSDPEGFAKAFPGARMEVIDRKTGRRGDVDVKDAGRIGDFGANLFTGRRVKKQPQQQPKTALGKAQQSVAQEKWGDKPLGAKAVDYTKPGSFGDLMKQEDAQMDAYNGETQKAIKEMAARTRAERKRMDAPVVDTGNANVNKYVVNTQGQMERQMMDSGRELADKHLGGYVSKSIENVFKDATARGVAAEDALSKASPFASMWAGEAYNEALDPDKLIAQLSKKAEKDMAGLFANPKTKEDIKLKAAAYGVAPEEYVSKILAPGLQAKIAEEFDKSELSRSMPKSTAEYIIRGVNDSMIGTILSMGMMSKKQRQYAQQGMAMTDNGENPYVKPGMGARVARGTLSFVADAPAFGAAGKAGAAVAGKAFGNGVAQAARIANTSLAGRIGRMVGTGAVSQGVTGVLYGSTNAAVQNYSTGDDTSIGNTVKLMTMGGLSEGASWATMGGIGGAVGAGIYNVSGVKRIPAKVFQIAMEGVGMHMGGNVAKMIEGHDTDWLSVEGNLEACANVVALKLTHARLPKRQVMDGKKESYLDMVARNIKNLMTSDGQRAAFGGYTFTNEEKEQLFGSDKAPKREETLYGYDVHDNPLTRKESLTSWAMRAKKTAAKGKGEESYKDTDTEFVKTAYDEIMADETIPWDTKAKFSALVMGTVPSARPMMDHIAIERDERGAYVGEYSLYGELLSKNRYKTADEYVSIKYNLGAKKENQRLSNAYGAAQIKDEKAAQETLETVAETFGFTAEQLKAAMDKDPLKRSEEEQNACVALRKAYEGEQFPEGTLHPEQSQTEGKDVVEENNLGTEKPNNAAVSEVLDALAKAEDALQAAMDGNDVFKQEYERLKKENLSNPQIYMELINSGLTQEQLAPLADYINANAKAQGMFNGTQAKIVETTQKHVADWSYKGELNGEKQEGGQMLFVKDNNGRLLIVGAGDVAFDSKGRARESVGDMLSVLDPNTKEMDFVSKKDVQLDHVEKTEDYAKNYQTMLEELNSTAYAESEERRVKSEKADTKPSEASLSLPKPGEQPKGEDAPVPVDEDVKPIGEGEKKNPSDNGNGSNETLTFADGSPVPMMKDSKGRETADYSQMTPEHGAEWMSSQFGENAEAAVDGQIKRAEKMLKDAEKIKVDYTGDLNDAKEAEAQKKMAVDAAKAELELYTNIKKAMTANKVKAGMEKVGSVGEVGSVGNVGVAREKFASGTRIVGNKRTRTLADGTKIKGHYELVEADSLTPSHNANDGYKKNEGFPVNEEGRTINDRDYENDKDAQRVTDMIARHYDGQAVDQVPVVTTDGIVVDGNGRTMAGQKAAKDGTDGAYLEALKENAENYGFTAEQIEQSGMKHPRLVLVSDEPMKYDTATFAKFNMNEKKSQGNTQQAVANSKKLSTDEISVIVSEIEGSGSLDAFFNNSTAINSLLKRLVDKGVIGLNEIAGLREGEDRLSASGKDFVKNLLLGSVFSENTIRMMGADAMLKTKALNGIRAVTDNMKLGDYALMKEIDQAVQLLYEARQGGSGVDAYLRTPAMFGENAADRYDPISQAIALALEGKVEDFRELMMAYNRNAAPYADANQTEMFGERPTKEDFVNEFLKLRNWKDYETRHSSKEGNGDAGSSEGTEPQAPGGSEPTEGQREVDKAVKRIATEITKKTGIEVVTDEKEAEEVIRESEETDSDLKYHKETDEATLEELENGETVKVYRAMQVIDGKLYPPMAAVVNGKRVEANELGVWIRADENPDLAIPDIDPKTKEQKVDKKTGELKWKFKLDKGGKDATGKKATDIPAAYNPYWHTSRSPLNDQFKSAWIRPNIVVVECEVPVSELSSGYRAERAKDAVGEVDWKSGVVSGEVYKQTGRARKVILSRWCKPVRVLSDAEVAQRAKEFVGDAKVEIPENVLTPRQRIEFEKAGFKIGAPEKGVKKSDQINEALKRGLQIDNSVKEFRTRDGEVYGFTDGKKIYLDTKKMKPETPLHEYAHLWCDMLRKVNPNEWENVKKLFDKVESLKEEVKKLYPELKDDALYEEMITTYSGREGTKKLEDVVRKLAAEEGKSVTESAKAQGFLEKVKVALTKYWKGVADVLGIHFTTAEEVADKVLADWAKGVDPRESEEGKVKSEESDTKPSEASLGLPKPGEQPKVVSEGTVKEREQALLEEIDRGGVKKKDDALMLLSKAEDLVDDYYGVPHNEWRREPSRNNTIDTILGWARNTLEKIKDEPIELATERQMSYIEKLNTDDPTTQKMLEGVELNKRQASWLINKLKYVNENLMHMTREDIEDTMKEIHDGIEHFKKVNGKPEGAKPEGDGKALKANPLEGMRKAAELFKNEQIEKARAELAEAKKSGDASEVKRLTDKLKGLMDSKLRGNGIGLVERRKIIGEELGKVLGEEAGKAEAEKVDKPWNDMEFDEQVAETGKKPLTADEIKNSDCDGIDKANAVAYLNGEKNIINTLSYLTVYDNVRNRERDSVPSIGTEDGAQLDAADNAGGEGLGRTDSRPQGVGSGQLGGNEGDGTPKTGESVQRGQRVSGGESGEIHPTAAVGEQGGKQVHGGTPGMEPVSAGGAKPEGGRGVRGEGRDVRERGNEGSGDNNNGKVGEATGGRGIDSRNLSTIEQIDKEISDTQSLVDDLFNSLFDGRTKGSINSDRANGAIIPLASDHLLGKLGMNKQKMAVYKQLIPALTKLGYLHIKKGIVKLNDWIDAMKGSFGGHLTKLGLSEEEVYDYIKNMWNSNIEVDGVTRKLSEWASVLGTERMKKEIAIPKAEKYKRQVAAEPIKVKVGDKKNIEETLPYLLPQQQEDVLRAETQFFGNEHADREHAYGKGYMFTNGTGTGKTFTGLGIAKRLVKQGKGRILIVTPSQKKVSDWIKDGRNLNMEIRDLDDWAKERGTTATTESGEGVVITTFANFGVNKKLLETKWDAVIYDESHRIMENKKGTETARSMQHYMVTNRDESHCFLRLQETNKDYQKQKSLGEQFDIERAKETERIRKEYKASHPSATERDVAYATSRMVPRDVYNFTPSDYVTFPVLGKIHAEYVKALSHYTNEVKPKLEAQAKTEWKDTKTIFLSATPFNTRENLDYVEGYIFKYPESDERGMSGRTQFYLNHFGAAYKYRYHRLEQSTNNPEAVAKQEIAFSDYLQHTLGTMSGRIIDSPYDYSRDFPTVSPDHAERFNQAVQEALTSNSVLAEAYRKTIGDYNYGSALFETMKVANIIERIKAHLDAGRKVVIFHRRVDTKEPIKPPFAFMLEKANRLITIMNEGNDKKNEAIQAVRDFRKKYADLLEWEQTLDYSMPREQIAKVFGKDKVLFFSGKESSKVKDKAVDTFNSDDSGKNIIVIQEASGKEGISLHDTTGKHQRVCITLALPQSPITALQIEGRTYRIGNKSNAIFEYPILGLNSEMMLFGEKFNNQVSTTENLALGSQARSLRDSFAKGILEHSGVVPIEQQGVGGKEFDAPKEQDNDPFDSAVLDYYSNQKLNSRNREGVDYFPTPEPLGYKMVEWANMGEGDTMLEPSAGHGAIARYAPKGNQMVAIEPSQSLFTKLQLKAGGLGRKFQNTIFENYDISNKHDVVVMNPPFGTAGATAIAHLGKAFKHLEEGGRVVAIIPRGSTDKKFEKWIEGEKTAVMRAEVELPDILFEQAGTHVVCRVVVVDKISNEAMRAKAGSVEKWDLGGHYDKIEDFFEDLRDVEMPDRIIDTNAIMIKKSKQTVKDLKELKGVRVDLNEHGINVRVRGDWKDYSIMFDLGEYNAEQRKSILSGTYERLEEYERQTSNETSQAVIAELKKLSCKLAGMTEEEMQRYLKKQNDGKGVMYRVEHAAEVYNKAKGGGSKGQRYGRVVPEDVDKKTSEGIEKKFDEEIGEIESDFDSKEEFMQAVSDKIFLASRYRKSVLENQKKQLENELRRKESNTGENSEGAGTGRLASVNADNKTTLQGHRDKAQDRIALAAINRELDYRRVRAENLRNTYGLSAGSEIGFGEVEKIFRQSNTSPELGKLFAQTRDVLKRLGVDFGVLDEINSGKLTSPMGYASSERDIRYSIDGLVKTSSSKVELPVTILHEMIHEGVNGAIHLVKSGKADGMLTPKQIEAVETISEIYDRAVGNQEKFRENNYGLEDEYEFAAQMADPRQRKSLDLGVMDRVVNFAKELMRKGDRSVWERVKDAVKKLFEVSDKSKMDKAIEDILSDFNKTIDDAAMADVDENGWSYSDGKAMEDKPRYASLSLSKPLEGRIAETVEKVSKQTGGKVKMVNSVEDIENPKVRKDIESGKQVTGWYDEKTGEVHLYMPNIHDTYTAEKTVWHETVGHKGMRGLLGDKFNDYMRGLWMDLDNPINAELRAYVKEKMNMNHLGFYDAIEEFIAKSAEDGKGEPGFWNYIKNKVTDALHEIGYRVSPNVKDVKYMLWLAKNVQKHGDSTLWKMRAEAVRWKIEHEKTEYTKIEGGELYDNDGKSHDFEGMSREEWLEATDGEIHYRTAPSAATALDRYHHALDRHSYMATEAFMDNMLSLKKLMEAIDPSIRKIEDVASSMNPYLMQNITEGKMSDKFKLFEIRYMDPLSKAMSSVLDSFDGKKVEDRIRNFNLYMIRKHGLERNRVLFVRDKIREERKVKSEESDSIDALETAWKDERSDLRQKLDSGQIDLKEYYRQMDEWIVQNLDKDFKAEEHDYSGMHGLQGIDDMKSPYDDAGAIDDVMSQEASMESMKKGSVADFWKKVKAATDYSVNSDYESGLISQITHDGVLDMFDWYVPLRKFDEATAEDVYGYVTEMGDPSNYIGTTLMNAKGRKSLSNVEILAQIGLMGNRAIRNGGQNMIKQAFARFVRNSGEQNLVKETKVWVEKTGTDLNGNDIWEEAYPQIPEGASADDVASIVDAFETDMRTKQAKGEAKSLSNGTDIGFKFQRAKDKSQHFVDVKIAGRTHRFVVLGNPRAAQALNGMLENGKASQKWLQTVTRWMAMASTSWSPEFVMRNIVRDMEFASSHVAAKEGGRYLAKWSRYYGELNPLNMFYNEGAGSLKSMKWKDLKNGVGYGLYARYREGTLGNSKMELYFKEFMENGGETGFVQLFSMHDMEKSYKSIVEKESAKGAKKVMVNAVEVLKKLGKNVENLNEVAENMARFATYCTSRDLGRSAARSAYDAKEVSTNFNRHGSGDAIKSFKNGEMGDWQKARRNTYGFVAGYLRNYSMFFNAGIQSTNLLFKNIKRAPVGTTVAMTSAPFALALIMAAVNNAIIQNEDDKDRGNVKDPYGELPDYIRRNNLCIYVGKNRFVTVPLAIELRAFYSLGDLAAGQTFAKNVKSQRNMAMDAVGCMSQLFPVMDFLNNPNYEKSLGNGVGMTTEGIAPTAIVPFIEWWLNNDWKGAPIRRTGDKTELNPAWQNAYSNVPARLVDLNKWVNAKTNNIAPGNPEMKGNEVLDWATDPSMLNHFFGSWSGGMGTFTQRTAGLGAKATTGKTDEIEVGDVPFLRSLFYTPREQSSMARTKAKWYNYKEEMEQTIANNDKLKSKNVPTMKRIENAAALEKFEGSPEQRKVTIIKNAEKRMRHWNTMRKKWADDKKQVDFANKNIEMIMQEAVEDLDRIE